MDPNQPLFNGPYQSPAPVVQPSQQNTPPEPSGAGKSKKLLITIAVGVVVLVLVILGVLLAVNSGGKSGTQTSANQTKQSSSGPEAATSSSIQQIDSSISQDISNLNQEKDFSAEKLNDKNLGL